MADFSFLPLFKCLSPRKVLDTIVGVLLERRIIVLSKHLSILGPVCQSLVTLIYPFKWQHVFLPVVIRPDLAALAKSKKPFYYWCPSYVFRNGFKICDFF